MDITSWAQKHFKNDFRCPNTPDQLSFTMCFLKMQVLSQSATYCMVVSWICQSEMVKGQRWCVSVKVLHVRWVTSDENSMITCRCHKSLLLLLHTVTRDLFWSNFPIAFFNSHLLKLTPFLLHFLVFHFNYRRSKKNHLKTKGRKVSCSYHYVIHTVCAFKQWLRGQGDVVITAVSLLFMVNSSTSLQTSCLDWPFAVV